MDWLDLLAVQGTLKNLLQHRSSKASILRRSAFFTVQLSRPYMRPDGQEELPHVRGQGQWPTVPGCNGAETAERNYPALEVMGDG